MSIKFIKTDICEKYNLNIDNFELCIKNFEKMIKNKINKYSNKDGLEDYKMKKNDYIIFYNLYLNTTNDIDNKINILLYYIYSFYKLDGIDFNKKKFPLKQFFDFLNNNNNIHKIIIYYIIKLS